MLGKRALSLTVFGAALMLAVGLIMPATVFAGTTNTYSFSAKNADAGSYVEQPDGSYENTYLWGGTISSKSTGSQTRPQRMRGTFGFTYHEQYLPATDSSPETYRLLIAQEVPAVFTADNKLTKASLTFSGPAQLMVWYDEMPWECDPAPDDPDVLICPDPDVTRDLTLTVSASWTGSGALERGAYVSRGRSEGFFFVDRFNYLARQAVATGSIVDSTGTVYFEGTFDYGVIFDNKTAGHFKVELLP